MATTNNTKFTPFPRHIAIIMDGNRRWAKKRGLSSLEGHRAGVDSLRTVVKYLGKKHLTYLTVFGFSTENWQRSGGEVSGLLRLLGEVLKTETGELHKNNVRLLHLGRPEELPPRIRRTLKDAVELTKNNRGLVLSIAFNYGGRAEIIQAIKGIVKNHIASEEIDEKLIDSYLYTSGIPDVDLVIRTGGETRLSNFLIWQIVYSEIYFTDVLWPDFNAREIDKALLFYSQKQRRFGG